MSRKSSLGNMSETMPSVEDIEKAGFASRWLNPQDEAGKRKKKFAIGALALVVVCAIVIGAAVGASGATENATQGAAGADSNNGAVGPPTPVPVGAPTEPPVESPTVEPTASPSVTRPTNEPTAGPTVTEDERAAAFRAAGKHCGIVPKTVTTVLGYWDSVYQSVAGLQTIDLSNTTLNAWESYVSFQAVGQEVNKKEHETHVKFEIPAWVPMESVRGLMLETNFQGENGRNQLWDMDLRNEKDKTWEKVWDNVDFPPWVWTRNVNSVALGRGDLSKYMLSSAAADRTLTLRLLARDNVEFNALFDYISICITTDPGSWQPVLPQPTAPPPPRDRCFTASGMSVVSGSLPSAHTAANMKVQELSGTEDDWAKYAAFRPENEGAEFRFVAEVDPAELPTSIVGVRAFLNYRGPPKQQQRWVMQVFNRGASAWEDVVDNVGVQTWRWSSGGGTARVSATAKVADYVDAESKMLFRWTTSSGLDAALIDYAAFCVVSEFDDLLSSPEPTGSPTPKPTRFPTFSPTTAQPTPPTTPNPTGSPTPPTLQPTRAPFASAECVAERNPHFAKWAYEGGVCGLYVIFGQYHNRTKRLELLQRHKDEGCRTIMLDTKLSYFLDDEAFDYEMAFIDNYANDAHTLGLKMIVYWPTLEIMSRNADTEPNKTAGFLMRDSIQRGLDGKPNLFVGGGLEHWVADGEESAWFDPENPQYTENYFLPRVRKLAATAADGLWGDVPLYYETGASWSGGTELNRVAFKAWSAAKGLCDGGCDLPDHTLLGPPTWSFSQARFQYWLVWRHYSLAKFLNKVRLALLEVNPGAVFMVENYPADYMDNTLVGLDNSFFDDEMRKGMSTVWEIDSVSNANGMKYAHKEDFMNQVIMRKYARGVDKLSPTWTFAYAKDALDSAMVLSGAFAVGTNTLETKTPYMTSTASASTRTAFYNWVLDNSCQVMEAQRFAQVAVLYSSSTRDVSDFATGKCWYAMYVSTDKTPSDDDEFWASEPGNSAKKCPHVSDYRGASYTLSRLHVPFKIVVDTALVPSDLAGVSVLWIPAASAMSAAAASVINDWVLAGGTVMATGNFVPATLDEFGRTHASNPLQPVFGRFDLVSYTRQHGKGVAYLRKDINATHAFTQERGSENLQSVLLDQVEQIIRIHVYDYFYVEKGSPMDVHIELTVPRADQQSLFMVNYAGMQQPVVRNPQTITFFYRPPDGKVVASMDISTPNPSPASAGKDLRFERVGSGSWIKVAAVVVDTLTMFDFTLIDAPAANPPALKEWSTPLFKEVAEEAMSFILDKMRDATRQAPWKYGVFTNLNNPGGDDPLYAYGHHHSGEHMGLILRAAACMGYADNWSESLEFVEEVMVSPLYKVINWAIDYVRQRAFLYYGDWSDQWYSATAPLDDFRTIQGLLEGAARFKEAKPAAAARARNIAHDALRAMYWTTVTDRYRTVYVKHPSYPNGLMGTSFSFSEVDDDSVAPPRAPAVSSGNTSVWDTVIAVNYQEVDMLHYGCDVVDPRFCGVLNDAVELMLAAQIPNQPGLSFNTYYSSETDYYGTAEWGGDWEFIGDEAHKFLKVIQELWTAIHLAKASKLTSAHVPNERKLRAGQAANQAFEWFKSFYVSNGRIPEYVSFDGQDVPDCPFNGGSQNCLDRRWSNSIVGEPRIYTLFVTLGNILGKDADFLKSVITDKVVPDRITDPSDVRFGAIGQSALSEGRETDADAWNSLEPILAICKLETGF